MTTDFDRLILQLSFSNPQINHDAVWRAKAKLTLQIKSEENEQLRGFEQSKRLKPKARLRAQAIRLNAAGQSRRRTAQYTGWAYGTVCRDLKRWYERGVDGLADAPATN